MYNFFLIFFFFFWGYAFLHALLSFTSTINFFGCIFSPPFFLHKKTKETDNFKHRRASFSVPSFPPPIFFSFCLLSTSSLVVRHNGIQCIVVVVVSPKSHSVSFVKTIVHLFLPLFFLTWYKKKQENRDHSMRSSYARRTPSRSKSRRKKTTDNSQVASSSVRAGRVRRGRRVRAVRVAVSSFLRSSTHFDRPLLPAMSLRCLRLGCVQSLVSSLKERQPA